MSEDHGSLAEEAARLAEALDDWVRAATPQVLEHLSSAAGSLRAALATALGDRDADGHVTARPPVQPIPVD